MQRSVALKFMVLSKMGLFYVSMAEGRNFLQFLMKVSHLKLLKRSLSDGLGANAKSLSDGQTRPLLRAFFA